MLIFTHTHTHTHTNTDTRFLKKAKDWITVNHAQWQGILGTIH